LNVPDQPRQALELSILRKSLARKVAKRLSLLNRWKLVRYVRTNVKNEAAERRIPPLCPPSPAWWCNY